MIQLENIASHAFVLKSLKKKAVYLHAIWFEISSGEIYYFSRRRKQFVTVNDANLDMLLDDVYYMDEA